jgi:hypothetical protein
VKEEKAFDKDLNDEFEEILSELKEEYDFKSAEYNKNNKAWKFQQTKKVKFIAILNSTINLIKN